MSSRPSPQMTAMETFIRMQLADGTIPTPTMINAGVLNYPKVLKREPGYNVLNGRYSRRRIELFIEAGLVLLPFNCGFKGAGRWHWPGILEGEALELAKRTTMGVAAQTGTIWGSAHS